MNENYQKVNQILESLRLSEQGAGMPGMSISTPVITGEARTALIAELVRLLTSD